MRWATAKADGILPAAQRDRIDTALRQLAGSAQWRASQRAGRTYGLLTFVDEAGTAPSLHAAAAEGGIMLYDSPVIALAVYPSVAEALPYVCATLSGAGRPSGVRSCDPCGHGGLAVEWDLEITPAAVVLSAIDVELQRFASGRVNELLTPLPPPWLAKIAAGGLQTPEISPDRVLETLLARAGLCDA